MNEQYIQSVVKTVEKIKDFLLVFVGIRKTLVKPARILSLLFSLGERRERRGSDLTQYYRREHHSVLGRFQLFLCIFGRKFLFKVKLLE